MERQSTYSYLFQFIFIIGSFATIFVLSAYASTADQYDWNNNQFLNDINHVRSAKNLKNLVLNDNLSALAAARLSDMVENNYFAHESPSNNDIDSIFLREHYKYELRGENLAYGDFVNEADVMDGWLNSKWHKYNIEYPDFNNIGIASRVVHNYMGGDYILVVTIFTKEKTHVTYSIDNQLEEEKEITPSTLLSKIFAILNIKSLYNHSS
jgi:uncharacterized protein YkwD